MSEQEQSQDSEEREETVEDLEVPEEQSDEVQGGVSSDNWRKM